MRIFAFLGRPGSGKGTFAELVIRSCNCNIAHFSIGDHLRRSNSDQLSDYLQSGKLVPDDVVCRIVDRQLLASTSDIILDGFPRSLKQAQWLLKKYGRHLTAIHIDLAESVALEKLLGRRVCSVCDKSFNVAHIVSHGYDMPAILPDINSCPRGLSNCERQLISSRADDTRDIIEKRFLEYKVYSTPILDFFHEKHCLIHFEVKKGIADAPSLLSLMMSK